MTLSDTAIKRPVFTTMVILAIVTYGVLAYQKLGIDLFPNIDFPIITVLTIYPGADPESIETKVTKKIEDAVNQVSMIKMLRSVSLQNVSQVLLQFELGKNIDVAAQEVRDKITTIIRDLPSDIEQPIVQKVDISAAPVITLAVSSEAYIAETALFQYADKIVKQQLQKIQGVGSVKIVGGRDRVIWIYLDPQKLMAQHLTADDIVRAVAGQNMEIPAGNISTAKNEIAIKTKGLVTSLDQLRRLTIGNIEGSIIKLQDVATIADGMADEKSRSLLDDKKTLTLVITKQPGTNTVEMAKKIRAEVPGVKALAPKGMDIKIVMDNAVFIEDSIKDSILDLELGAVFAILIIGVFLRNLRMTFIAAVAIPTSVIGTFAAIKMLGFTLNFLTLLGLSLSVGLLVDDAIVVLENIFRHYEEDKNRLKAAKTATEEIGLAVMAITFSLVAVFFPIATTGGMIGKFLKEFGLTVSIAVLLSLFVSFTLTPMLASRFMKEPAQNFFTRMVEKILEWGDSIYSTIIRWSLHHRFVIILLAVITLGATLYLSKYLAKEMQPQMDQAEFNINLESPPGSSLDYTQSCVMDIIDGLKSRPEVSYTLSTIAGGQTEKKEEALIYVKLVERQERKISQMDFMQQLREQFKNYKKATVAVTPKGLISVGMSEFIVQLNLLGPDLTKLNAIAERMKSKMIAAGGYTDIDITYKPAKPEFNIEIDRDRAAQLNIPVAMIGSAMRVMFAGVKASEYKEAGEMYDVNVRLLDADRTDFSVARRLSVRSPAGVPIELDNLIKTSAGSSPQDITRISGQRTVTLYSNLIKSKALGTAVGELKEFMQGELPPGYTSKFTGQIDFMKENFDALFSALFLGIIMIYFILASQFESFLHPFTIMFSLPFSLIGAIGALLLASKNLSMLAMIGFIMLMGLVTKNAVLIIDFAIKGRASGMPLNEAIIRAGVIRLRPILMTTFAMIFGMVPIAFGNSKGSEMRSPMAIAVIGGLITSTILTLVVIPVIFNLLENLKGWFIKEPQQKIS